MKHLLRKHIWKDGEEQTLRRERVNDVGIFVTYVYYALIQTCVLCGKSRLVERRRLLL